jgi:hypothetical protein
MTEIDPKTGLTLEDLADTDAYWYSPAGANNSKQLLDMIYKSPNLDWLETNYSRVKFYFDRTNNREALREASYAYGVAKSEMEAVIRANKIRTRYNRPLIGRVFRSWASIRWKWFR